MKQKNKDYTSYKIKDLENEKEELDKKLYDDESFGNFSYRTGFGTLALGILGCGVFCPVGISLIGLSGFMLATGWVNMAKAQKTQKKIEKIDAEIKSRPKQLEMTEFLKETYKPNILKGKSVNNYENDNNNDLSL